jgi:hypothetical protein
MDKVYVADCELGKGLFVAAPIRKGEVIGVFSGPLVPRSESMSHPNSFNLLQVGSRTYMEVAPPTLYINHSCEPNSGVRGNTTVIALRDLEPGEEIRFDYSTTMSEDLETMPCRCGADSCRGLVQDFRHLPPELKRHYLRLGIVQDFIVQEELEAHASVSQQQAHP